MCKNDGMTHQKKLLVVGIVFLLLIFGILLTKEPFLISSSFQLPFIKTGLSCVTNTDCQPSLVCHNNQCTKPILGDCSFLGDTSCTSGYTCVQKCGPPLARFGDKSPGYQCMLQELAQRRGMCPVCLASNTQISTPTGKVNVKDLTVGMRIYSLDKMGNRVVVVIEKVSSTPVLPNHQVVRLTLADGRRLWVSPNHPTVDGKTFGLLQKGQSYDGSVVKESDLTDYWDARTYDLLPDSPTGFYFANDILVASTLK